MFSPTTQLLASVLALFAAPQIDWYEGAFTSALGSARHRGQPLAIYFWSPASQHCQRFWAETMQSTQGEAALDPYLCLSADISRSSGADLLGRFGVTTVPTLLVLSEDGQPEDGVIGYAPAAVFVSELQRIQGGSGTVSDLRRRIAAETGDREARYTLMLQLSNKLGQLGQQAESDGLLATIRKEDPEGATVVGSRLAFWDIRDAIEAPWLASGDPAHLELGRMHEFVPGLRHPVARFEAHQWLADRHALRGEVTEARAALAAAWPDVPDAQRLEVGAELVLRYWDSRKGMKRGEKAFALEVATVVHDAVRARFPDPEATDAMTDEDRDGAARGIAVMALALDLKGARREARKLANEARALAPGNTELVARLDTLLE